MFDTIVTYSVFDIPRVMHQFTFWSKHIAFALVPLLVILSEMEYIINAAEGKTGSDPLRKVLKIIIVIIALFIFRHIFMKIVALFEAISWSLFSAEKWNDFISGLNTVEATVPSGLFHMNLQNIILLSFLFLAQFVAEALNIVRFALLCVLYMFGPIAIAASLWKQSASITRGWFTNLLQIAFWVVMLSVIKAVMVSTSYAQYMADKETMLNYYPQFLLISIVLVVLILSIPILSAKILSGGNVGLVGSAAMGLAAGFAVKYGTDIKDAAGAGYRGIVKGTRGIKVFKEDGIKTSIKKAGVYMHQRFMGADSDAAANYVKKKFDKDGAVNRIDEAKPRR